MSTQDKPQAIDEAFVREWFSERYKAGDVFHDGAESLSLEAAIDFARAAAALAAAQQAEPDADTWRFLVGADAATTAHLQAGQYLAPAAQQAEPVAPSIVAALRFYAQRHHFALSDPSAWDTVSGEPPNYWCDEAGTATVEDGSIAKIALEGINAAPPAREAVALTEEQAKAVMWQEHVRWMSAAGLDTTGMQPEAGWLDQLLGHFRAFERAVWQANNLREPG